MFKFRTQWIDPITWTDFKNIVVDERWKKQKNRRKENNFDLKTLKVFRFR